MRLKPMADMTRSGVIILAALLLMAGAATFPSTAIAANAGASDSGKADILTRVRMAYGDKKLESLETVGIRTNRKMAWPGQGQTADYVEFISDRFDMMLDLKSEKGRVERWTYQNGNVYSGGEVSVPEGKAIIDYFTGTYSVDESEGFAADFGWVMNSSDMLLAYNLLYAAQDVTVLAPQMYRGVMYDRVSFNTLAGSPQRTVYIDKATGLIGRVSASGSYGVANTLFTDYSQTAGIPYATQKMSFRNDALVRYERNIEMTVNAVKPIAFELDSGLIPQPEQVDQTEMTVDSIAPNVFHVGQAGSYSTFVDAGDYIVGFNAYADLEKRFKALQKIGECA